MKPRYLIPTWVLVAILGLCALGALFFTVTIVVRPTPPDVLSDRDGALSTKLGELSRTTALPKDY